MSEIAWSSSAAWLLVVLAAGFFRSRSYAFFMGIILGIHTLVAVTLLPLMGPLLPLALGFHAAVYLDGLVLIRPKLRPAWFRLLITWPSKWMAGATFMAFPWAIVAALGFEPYGFFLPYILATVGLAQSLGSKVETRNIVIGEVDDLGAVQRLKASHNALVDGQDSKQALRVAQITDPHLGPFMSVARLARICQRVVDQDPDLVFLTGDFLTMESQEDKSHLSEALAPLAQLKGKVFACMGNHDHEAPATVKSALSTIGAQLLIDEATTTVTPAGTVQIVGFDFHFRERKERMAQVLATYPRVTGIPRLALLHDPGAFKEIETGQVDLAFSGHTHGGQVGLLSLGLVWTLVGAVAKMPDHGLWGHGTNRLYVHRGTGHYGFPLRLGVPAEESILAIHHLRS